MSHTQPVASSEHLLAIYLKDHFTGSTVGLQLFQRAATSQSSPKHRAALEVLAAEIASDRQTLLNIMAALGVRPDLIRYAFAWAGEKAARLKLNGGLLRRSPLSDVLELESMYVGVTGKERLWHALLRLQTADVRLEAFDFDVLISRAQQQKVELEQMRLEALDAVGR